MSWDDHAKQPHARHQPAHDEPIPASVPEEETTATIDRKWSTVDFRDPRSSEGTVGEWVAEWLSGIDVGASTAARYRSALRCHILPRWAQTPLTEITNQNVARWAQKLHTEHGLAPASVDTVVGVFSIVLADAVAYCHLPNNPIRRHAWRGRAAVGRDTQRSMTPDEVLRVADQVAAVYGPGGAVLIVTAAWTGARWSELGALRRPNLHLLDGDSGYLYIDPGDGALYESGTKVWLDPPKTVGSARQITLPPFLVRLLRAHLATGDHPHVFTTPEGALHHRSAFRARALRHATYGKPDNERTSDLRSRVTSVPTFHEFRRSHRAWLIEDGIAPVIRGHRLGEKAALTTSPTLQPAERGRADLLGALQSRWRRAVEKSQQTGEWRRGHS